MDIKSRENMNTPDQSNINDENDEIDAIILISDNIEQLSLILPTKRLDYEEMCDLLGWSARYSKPNLQCFIYLVDYFQLHYPNQFPANKCYIQAAIGSKIECMKYMHQRGILPLSSDRHQYRSIVDSSILSKNVDCIRFVVEVLGIAPYISFSSRLKLFTGIERVDILKLMTDYGYEWSTYHLHLACSCGAYQSMVYLHETCRVPMDYECKHSEIEDPGTISFTAIEYNQFECLVYAHKMGSPLPTRISSNRLNRDSRIKEYLINNGCIIQPSCV
jgi:hypothetical protein